MSDPQGNHYKVSLTGLAVEMKVGIADWERHPDKTQTVEVDIDLWAMQDAFTGRDINDCMNYARIFDYVTKNWAGRPHTDLLETLIEEAIAFCFEDRLVDVCRVTIRKPHVFNGRAIPAVSFYRKRA